MNQRNRYLTLVFLTLCVLTVRPVMAMGAAETEAIFKRCLAKPIESDVKKADLGADTRSFVDNGYGIRWMLPSNFRIVAKDQGKVLVVASSKSNTFGVVVEKPYLHRGRKLGVVVKDYLRQVRRTGVTKVLSRKRIRFGGLPAVRLYLQTKMAGKVTCASEVFVRRGRYVYQITILQRLYQGYCISDVLIGSIMSDWTWIKARALKLEKDR